MIGWLGRILGGQGAAAKRADPAAFAAYLGTRAAFVAQKTVLDYCAVKFGRHWEKAQADAAFAEALAACRWAVFWPAGGDLFVAGAAWLQPLASEPARMIDRLADLVPRALDAAGAAAGGPDRAEAERQIRLRLAALATEAPPRVATMKLAAAAPLLATLPVHPDQRVGEEPAIVGGLRMNFLAMVQDLERAFDPAPLAAALQAMPDPASAAAAAPA
jgi:hypothetical protein